MTTNSPNPVDGDVQALIADCEAEIAELEKRLTTWGEAWIPYLQSKLRRQQIALAALTAEPLADVVSWFHPQEERKCAVQLRRFDLMPGCLYTTPPAQLFRPVELPPMKQTSPGPLHGLQALIEDTANVSYNNAIGDIAELLRQQGYEVKND